MYIYVACPNATSANCPALSMTTWSRAHKQTHLRVPPANCNVVLQSPQEGVGRFVREDPLGEDDCFVLRVDSDEQHEVHTIPERFNARARMVSLEAVLLCVKI